MSGRFRVSKPVQWVGLACALTLVTALVLMAQPRARAVLHWQEAPRETSLIAVVANPDRFEGQRVRAIGFMHLEFEGDQLCPSAEVFAIRDARSCLWIHVPDAAARRLSDRYVIVEGRISSREHGHMGMFAGELGEVTRLDPWAPGREEP